MIVLEVTFHSFGTKLALVDREFFPGFKANHPFIMDFELNATLHTAKAAVGLDEAVRHFARLPAAGWLIIQVWTILLDETMLRQRKFRHSESPDPSLVTPLVTPPVGRANPARLRQNNLAGVAWFSLD